MRRRKTVKAIKNTYINTRKRVLATQGNCDIDPFKCVFIRLINLLLMTISDAEVRRRGSKDLLKVCVLLDRGQKEGKGEEGKPVPLNIYDTPYEGELEGDREGVWIPVTRPESDVRPAGEYELPWEWRKEDIVRVLSGRE